MMENSFESGFGDCVKMEGINAPSERSDEVSAANVAVSENVSHPKKPCHCQQNKQNSSSNKSKKEVSDEALLEELIHSKTHKIHIQMKNKLSKLLSTASNDKKPSIEKELDSFCRLFERFLFEEEQSIKWENIADLPRNAVKDFRTLETPSSEQIQKLLSKLIVVKLNGGLGTSMGCQGPKSTIIVRDGLNFLDLTVEQIVFLNTAYGTNVPLVLMNSFNTDETTQELIEKYKGLDVQIHTFTQSCFPRISEESLLPIPSDCNVKNDMEGWYPPGHGDFYESFYNSGLLNQFIEEGRKYCFVSNIDNLGAVVDLKILNLMDDTLDTAPEFVMEVTEKIKADVKGGTIIHYDGKLRLLESAQVPSEHMEDFKSVTTFKFFNTNNLWFKIDAIARCVTERTLSMEVIVNKKKSKGMNIIQLETAVGAAMKSFERSQGVNVPRSRFLPVKKTSDLLLVMSNIYTVKHGSLIMNPLRKYPTIPLIHLSDQHYKKVKDFLSRFTSIPDLLDLDFLTVSGNVYFPKGVSLKGTVIIFGNDDQQIFIPPYSLLENKILSGSITMTEF